MSYERRTGWLLDVAAVAFLAVYAVPILQPDLSPAWVRVCEVASWAVWGLFGADYFVRLTLAEDRRRFVRKNVVDLAVIVLPLLRPMRLVRLLPVLARMQHAGMSLRGRATTYVVAGAALLVLVASLAVLDAERGSTEANITSYGDALWWAAATVTTVGYGDRFPTTGEGRIVGVALMLGGITIVGTVTAALASWFVEEQQKEAP
ncbi:potassium channel family protein [Kribbella pittospori]|uniref:potassium channel family protein n=1 Tax=Kribbella pittospori TaxID=722689 RepID=UPI0013F49D77|nr:potassium channel family protein [Kribbella pittospori]